MKVLTLYSTAGCHLCEDAVLILQYCKQYEPAIEWQIVDIASDAALVERYGIRIPVVRSEQNGEELGWPFDAGQLMDFFKKQL